MERVDFTVNCFDNYIEIIPTEMKDNSIYEIRLRGVKTVGGNKVMEDEVVTFCTAASPAYCSVTSVSSLVGNCDVEDRAILYHIREASKYADYIRQCVKSNGHYDMTDDEILMFQKEMLTKYKAAYECILRFYVDKAASDGGIKGTLGDITFEYKSERMDISHTIKALKAEVDKWDLAVQGYNHIRAKTKTGIRASTSESLVNSMGVSQPEFSRRGLV